MNPETLAKANTEHAHQVAFFAWCAMAANCGFENAESPDAYRAGDKPHPVYVVPELETIHAVHNQGHGDRIRGARAKAEGVRAGIPDIFWPQPVWAPDGYSYAGLYIELKKPVTGRVSAEQREMMQKLERAGYCCVVAYGWREATRAVREYHSRHVG